MTWQENGVATAIQAIYRDLEYAKTLIKRRTTDETETTEDEATERWTLVGDDSDGEETVSSGPEVSP